MAGPDLGKDTVPPRELLKNTMGSGTSCLRDRLLSEPDNPQCPAVGGAR